MMRLKKLEKKIYMVSLVLILAFPYFVEALVQEEGYIDGVVLDEGGDPIEGATVVACCYMKRYTTTTGSDGSYKFEDIVYDTEGTKYRVEAYKEAETGELGYEKDMTYVELNEADPIKSTAEGDPVNFTLVEETEPKARYTDLYSLWMEIGDLKAVDEYTIVLFDVSKRYWEHAQTKMVPDKVYFQVFREGNWIGEYILDLCDNTFIIQEVLKVEILSIEDRDYNGEFEVEIKISSRERPTISLTNFALYENIVIQEKTMGVGASIVLDGYTFKAEATAGSFKIDVNKNGVLDSYEIFGIGDSFATITGDCINTRSYTVTNVSSGTVTLKPDVRELMNFDDFNLGEMDTTVPVSGKEIYMYAVIENVGNYKASDVVVSVDHFGYTLLNYCNISSNYIYVGDMYPRSPYGVIGTVWDYMDDTCHSNDFPCTEPWETVNGTLSVVGGYFGNSLQFKNDPDPVSEGKLFVDLISPDDFTDYKFLHFLVYSSDKNNNEPFQVVLEDSDGNTAEWNVGIESTGNWEMKGLSLKNPDLNSGLNLSKIKKVSFSGLNSPGGECYRFDHIVLSKVPLPIKKVILLRLNAPVVSYEEYHPITIGVNYKMEYVNIEGEDVEENFQEEFKKDINVYPKTVQLRIKQFVSYKKLILGEESDVIVTVENIGDLKAYDLDITDYLPSGLELIEGEASKTLSELSSGESTEFSYRMKAKEIGDYELITKVRYKDERGESYEMQSFPVFIIVYKEFPRLDMRKNIDKTNIVINEHIVVVLVVTNTGNKPAKDVVIVDSIPEEFSLTSSKEEEITGNVNVFKIDRMDPNEKKVFSYIIKADEPGKHTLKGCKVRYSDYENNYFEYESPDVNIDVSGIPKLNLEYSLSRESVQDGELLTVIGRASNIGNGLAKNVTLDHVFNKGELVDGELKKEIENLKNGEYQIYKFTVRVPVSSTAYDFSVDVTYSYYDILGNEYPEGAKTQRFVQKIDADKPKIEMARTVEKMIIKQNKYYVDSGYSFIISILATNTGTADAVDTILEEKLPEGFELINGTNKWEGDLKIGESKTITYTAIGNVGGVYSLTPKAIYKDKWGVSYSTDGKTMTFTLRGLTITKSVSKNKISEGDVVEVNISIKNYGDSETRDIIIEDSIPEGFELVEGETTMQKDLLGGNETMSLKYKIKAISVGEYVLEKAKVRWKNSYGESRQLESKEYIISVQKAAPPVTTAPPTTIPPETPVYEKYISTVLLILVAVLLLIIAIIGIRTYSKRKFKIEEEGEEEEFFEGLEAPEEEILPPEEKTPEEMFSEIALPEFEEEEKKEEEYRNAPGSIKKILEWQEKEEKRKKKEGKKERDKKEEEKWFDRDYDITEDMTPKEVLKGKKKKKEE